MRLASGAFAAGGAEYFRLLHQGSFSDQYRSAIGRSGSRQDRLRRKIYSSIHCWIDRARHPVDSRRDVREQIVLIGIKHMPTATPDKSLLEAQPREAGTKNDARRVRREGKIPAVVYGAGKDALTVSV